MDNAPDPKDNTNCTETSQLLEAGMKVVPGSGSLEGKAEGPSEHMLHSTDLLLVTHLVCPTNAE